MANSKQGLGTIQTFKFTRFGSDFIIIRGQEQVLITAENFMLELYVL